MSKVARFISSEVFSVAGPSELDGFSKGWSPKGTVNVFPPAGVTLRGTPGPPGMQFVFPVQSGWLTEMLGFSSWA
jgi:hypothetical protein